MLGTYARRVGRSCAFPPLPFPCPSHLPIYPLSLFAATCELSILLFMFATSRQAFNPYPNGYWHMKSIVIRKSTGNQAEPSSRQKKRTQDGRASPSCPK